MPAILAGILLVALAAPRLLSAVAAADAHAAMWDFRHGKGIGMERMDGAIAGLETASVLMPDGEDDTNRGILLAFKAQGQETPAAIGAVRDQARQALVRGLALAPGQPEAWLQLAWLRDRLGDRAGAVRAFRLSCLTGQVYPALTTARLSLGLELAESMDAETRGLLARQIRLAWVIDPKAVIPMAANPRDGAIVTAALAELGPAEMDAFHRLHGDSPP